VRPRPTILPLVLLAGACGALPDEIAVSGFRSEYDFLGGANLKELGADEGDSVGVAVIATYKLKPQDVRIVSQTPMRSSASARNPAELADRFLDQTADRLAQTADRMVGETADRLLGQTADRLAQTADNAGYLMLKSLLRPLLLVGGAIFLALLLVFLLFRRRPH